MILVELNKKAVFITKSSLGVSKYINRFTFQGFYQRREIFFIYIRNGSAAETKLPKERE